MPPHCDTLDGPVVKAAIMALERGNVNLILPWIPKEAESETKIAFEKAMTVRKLGKEAKELSEYWFFETVVRLHRAGEGAPYTGLKPAGLDEGPVVPRAEKALEEGNAKEVIEFLSHVTKEEIQKRFNYAMALKKYNENDVDAAREYVEAMLDFILYSHTLYMQITKVGDHIEEENANHKH